MPEAGPGVIMSDGGWPLVVWRHRMTIHSSILLQARERERGREEKGKERGNRSVRVVPGWMGQSFRFDGGG